MVEDRHRRVLALGEMLFQEGEPGDCAFVIESGALEVWRENKGQRDVLAVLGPGEMLGEMSLIDKLPRSASATARVETRLRIVTRQHLDAKLLDSDPLLRMLLGIILHRYRSVTSPNKAAHDDLKADREAVLKRLQLEQELELALERREFVLHYQPIVDLATMRPAGFEGLIRWVSPSRGFVSPGDFIPAVEQSHLVHGVGTWVMQAACEAVRDLNEKSGGHEVFVGFNLSGKQLSRPEFIDQLREALTASGIKPQLLKIEITESLLMTDFEYAIKMVNRCRELGVRIAVDDFGTGYSSLSYVHRLPVDTLKIDRSFVTPLLKDRDSAKVAQAIASLAHSLDMDIVAEGIEEVGQAEVLAGQKVEYGQGFLFSKAVPKEKAADLLAAPWPWAFERRSLRRRVRERRAGDRRTEAETRGKRS